MKLLEPEQGSSKQNELEPTKEKPEAKNDEIKSLDKMDLKNRSIWLQFGEDVKDREIQVGHSSKVATEFLDHSYVFTPKYWPIPSRRLQQMWRYLRNERKKIVGEEINISATVEKIAAEKHIDQPIYERAYSPEAQDVQLLFDFGGSMTPYAELSEYLKNSLIYALKPKKLESFYFRNQPNKNLFMDKGLFESLTINDWLRSLHRFSLIVIVSDAGAARDEMKRERVDKTRKFLKNVKVQTDRILWLNPLPRNDGMETSAFFISLFVEMLAVENDDLHKLSSILKKW